MSAINIRAILELREGLTGSELATAKINEVRAIMRDGIYANAHKDDRHAYEIGLLQAQIRRVCDLLAEAVEDPEPNPTYDDLKAFAAERAQDDRADRMQDERRFSQADRAYAYRAATGHAPPPSDFSPLMERSA